LLYFFGGLAFLYFFAKAIPNSFQNLRLRKQELELEKSRIELEKMKIELEHARLQRKRED
jgi:hypothetical protein